MSKVPLRNDKSLYKDFSTIFRIGFFCGFLWVMKRNSEKCEDVGNFMKKVFECVLKHFLKKNIFLRVSIQNFPLTFDFYFFLVNI